MNRKSAMTSPRRLGSLIGAVFGLIYVLVNSSSLPADAAIPLRAIGAIAFVAMLVAVARAETSAPSAGPRGFGPGFWPVVLGEVLALAAGLSLINGPLDAPKAAVAWISFVVGAHFIVLAAVFRERLYRWLGIAIGACGLAGLGLAALSAGAAPIAAVSGVIPGLVLLASGWWGTRGGDHGDHGEREEPRSAIPAFSPRLVGTRRGRRRAVRAARRPATPPRSRRG